MKKILYHHKASLILLLIVIASLTAHIVLAADTDPKGPLDLPSVIAANDVPSLINSMIKGILGIVGALSLLMFVYGGMLWLTSMGNSERINKGKETLTWATIGLIVIFSSYALLNVVIEALTK